MKKHTEMTTQEKLQEAQQIVNDGNGILRPYHIDAQFENRGVDYERLIGPRDRNRCCAFCENLERYRFGPHMCKVHQVYFGTVPTSVDGKPVTVDQAVDALDHTMHITEEFVCDTHFEPRSW